MFKDVIGIAAAVLFMGLVFVATDEVYGADETWEDHYTAEWVKVSEIVSTLDPVAFDQLVSRVAEPCYTLFDLIDAGEVEQDYQSVSAAAFCSAVFDELEWRQQLGAEL